MGKGFLTYCRSHPASRGQRLSSTGSTSSTSPACRRNVYPGCGASRIRVSSSRSGKTKHLAVEPRLSADLRADPPRRDALAEAVKRYRLLEQPQLNKVSRSKTITRVRLQL